MIRRVPAFDDEQHCPFEPGHVYQRKLPGLNGRPSFRVHEDSAPVRQRLADVTRADVIAEGRHGTSARVLSRWRIEWVKGNDRWAKAHRTASDTQVLERWRMVHADRCCWVLTIALLDPVRLLPLQRNVLTEVATIGRERQAGHKVGNGDEYTTGKTIDPYAEAVDEATLTRIVASELYARAMTEAQRRLRKSEGRRARVIRYRSSS